MKLLIAFTIVAAVYAAPRETETWCDPILGCLELTDDWYSETRPFNQLPESRETIDTNFYLHTREVPGFDENVVIEADDLTTVASSSFNASKPLKFVVHGFVDNGGTNWMSELAQDLLDYGDYNVFRVGWGHGSLDIYSQATANTRVVGLEISHLVNIFIETYGIDAGDVHIIGHSLGAHASGYAGEGIENLGRITGLDPAGPYFTDTETFIRLDPSDAVFVDNIHTDAGFVIFGFGTGQAMGNLDFFPNGGENQPGCDPLEITWGGITGDLTNGIRDVVACSHGRAINFFMETLTDSSCNWLAQECADYDTYLAGGCQTCNSDNTGCAYMGIRADEYVSPTRELVTLYETTDEEEPFCYNTYAINILTAYPDGASDWVMGNIHVTLYGSNGGVIEDYMITDKHESISHGTSVSYPLYTHEDIGSVLRAELEWNYDDTINPGTYCWNLLCDRSLYVDSVEITPRFEYPESDLIDATFLACSTDGSTTTIEDGDLVSFLEGTECSEVQ